MNTFSHSQLAEEGWQDFLSLIQRAVHEGELETLLSIFLTPDERHSLSMRVQITQELLKHQLPQRAIQRKLSTSAATITRGSNMLKSLDEKEIAWLKTKLGELNASKEA